MSIYLGLGANSGDRRRNIERAIEELVREGFCLGKVSPVVESPAVLPRGADAAWHKPYLNLVVSGEAEWGAREGLAIVKDIERRLGRVAGERWSPRPIDIDLLRWHNDEVVGEGLTIPHADACERDFVLTPLLHLQPDLRIGAGGESVFELTRRVRPIPLWMGVINVSPDSFAGGGVGEEGLGAMVEGMVEGGVHIIDVGAESTRPGGEAVSVEVEWGRLEPALAVIWERLAGRRVRPWVSVDSRRAVIIERAMRYGVDVINDVSGLSDPDMMALARSGCQVVAVHSLGVPVVRGVRLAEEPGAVEQVVRWAEERMEVWVKGGLDLNKIILDPGIGFGKDAVQCLALLGGCRELRGTGLRVLVGASRKSFMGGFSGVAAAERDVETVGVSLALCEQGVDVVRVHAAVMHARAYLGWAHVGGGGGV